MKTAFVALKAFFFMVAFVPLWGWIANSIRPFDQRSGLFLPEWTQSLGIFFMALGGALALACVGIFVMRGRGTPAPFDPPREFVAVGPYKYVRNPMYIGGLILLVGFGLYQHSGSILLFSFAWFLLAHLFVVYFEEPNLRRRFKSRYEDYRQAVPRWIPDGIHQPTPKTPGH